MPANGRNPNRLRGTVPAAHVNAPALAEEALRDSEAKYQMLLDGIRDHAIFMLDTQGNSYIRKPVDFDEFTEVVGTLGLYWLLCNQPPPAPRM